VRIFMVFFFVGLTIGLRAITAPPRERDDLHEVAVSQFAATGPNTRVPRGLFWSSMIPPRSRRTRL